MVPTAWLFSAVGRAAQCYSARSWLSRSFIRPRRSGQVDVFIHPQRSAISMSPEPEAGSEANSFASFNQVDGFEEAEAPGKQFFAFRLTAFERPAAHYRGDQAHLAFGGGM